MKEYKLSYDLGVLEMLPLRVAVYVNDNCIAYNFSIHIISTGNEVYGNVKYSPEDKELPTLSQDFQTPTRGLVHAIDELIDTFVELYPDRLAIFRQYRLELLQKGLVKII